MIFAYFGPETVLPLTSVLTGLAGVVLMFGRQIRLVGRIVVQRTVKHLRGGSKDQDSTFPRAGKRFDRGTTINSPHIHAKARAEGVPNQVEH